MSKVGDTWYRLEDHLYSAGVDEFDNPLGPPQLQVNINKFTVAKVTPKGVWLDRGWMGKRFVLSGTRRKYACPTLELALESFLARKQRQARIYQARADSAREAMEIAKYEVKAETQLIDTKKQPVAAFCGAPAADFS